MAYESIYLSHDNCGKPVRFATTFIDRLRGIFRYQTQEVTLIMSPCHSVHTFFLKQPIDVTFFDKEGHILAQHKKVLPYKVVSCAGAYGVLEQWSDDKEQRG